MVALAADSTAQGSTPSQPPPQAPGSASQQPTIPTQRSDQSGQNSELQVQNPAAEAPQTDIGHNDAGQFVFRKQVEEVVLHAVVIDQQNNLISNLSQSGFQVYEDGEAQQITSFHQEQVPVALGILIDNSGSMRPRREAVNQAALNLIRSSHPQDEIFVVNFGEEYYLDQDFTHDEVKLKAALDRVETRGSTALYDAIVASAAHMKQETGLEKRVLLVVTDGEDNASQETLQEAEHQLQQKDSPVVYMIALLSTRKNAGATAGALQTLSEETGGAAYFPTDGQQVDSLTRNIAAAVRSQYVIGYKSSHGTAGHVYHGIQVEAYDPGHRRLRVRTRTGYYSDSVGGAP